MYEKFIYIIVIKIVSLLDLIDGVDFNTQKGIVSGDFDILLLISLERYEVRNRAGSGLFLILMMFSYIIFFLKLSIAVEILWSE
jgi:hypothetical protein